MFKTAFGILVLVKETRAKKIKKRCIWFCPSLPFPSSSLTHENNLEEDEAEQSAVVGGGEGVVEVRELAAVEGALLARHEPGGADEVLLAPGARHAEHGEAAVNNLCGDVFLVLIVRK